MARRIWTIDPDRSRVDFRVRYLTFQTVTGSFTKWSGHFEIEDDDLVRSSVEVRIDPASVRTDSEARDRDLVTNFFEVDKYPEASFRSLRVARARARGQELRITGMLELHGISQELVLHAAPSKTKDADRLAFRGTADVKRKRFGVRWKSPFDVFPFLISSIVSIDFAVEAQPAP